MGTGSFKVGVRMGGRGRKCRAGAPARCFGASRSLAWQPDLLSEFSNVATSAGFQDPLWPYDYYPYFPGEEAEIQTSAQSLRVKERTRTRSWLFWLLAQGGLFSLFFWIFFFLFKLTLMSFIWLRDSENPLKIWEWRDQSSQMIL